MVCKTSIVCVTNDLPCVLCQQCWDKQVAATWSVSTEPTNNNSNNDNNVMNKKRKSTIEPNELKPRCFNQCRALVVVTSSKREIQIVYDAKNFGYCLWNDLMRPFVFTELEASVQLQKRICENFIWKNQNSPQHEEYIDADGLLQWLESWTAEEYKNLPRYWKWLRYQLFNAMNGKEEFVPNNPKLFRDV